MTKFLDYEGLKIFATKLKTLISAAQTTANNAASSATTANTAAATAKKRADDAYSLASDVAGDYVSMEQGGLMSDTAHLEWDTDGHTYIDGYFVKAKSIQLLGWEGDHGAVIGTDGVAKFVYGTGKIATLDENDNVPLSCLGNLDTTLFEVVETRPSTIATIKKHIYLVKDLTGANNQYTEWIYTGSITGNATYDATKWEKLGNFSASIDLSGYQKTNEAAKTFDKTITASSFILKLLKGNGTALTSLTIPAATTSQIGLMTAAMVTKLNGIASGANAYTLPTASSTVLGGVKVGANLVISSGVLNVEKISDNEINALFT